MIEPLWYFVLEETCTQTRVPILSSEYFGSVFFTILILSPSDTRGLKFDFFSDELVLLLSTVYTKV